MQNSNGPACNPELTLCESHFYLSIYPPKYSLCHILMEFFCVFWVGFGVPAVGQVFENMALREIFGTVREEGTGDWRKVHSEELHDIPSNRFC